MEIGRGKLRPQWKWLPGERVLEPTEDVVVVDDENTYVVDAEVCDEPVKRTKSHSHTQKMSP